MSHEDKDNVTGVVVDSDEKPVAGDTVVKVSAAPVTTDADGHFLVPCSNGTQFVMHAFHPGYQVWFGAPTAGVTN